MPAVTIGGMDNTEFRIITNGCMAPLPPAGSCPVEVELGPISAGPKSATLEVTASPGGRASAPLRGSTTSPMLAASPTTLPFGVVGIGEISSSQAVTISNTGTGTTGVPEPTVTGAAAGEFTVTSDCGAGLRPGGTCTLQVRFSPATGGARSASLELSATPGGTAVVALSGETPATATLQLSPDTHDFGATSRSLPTAPFTFTIKNIGATVTGSLRVPVTGADALDFPIDAPCDLPDGLQPGESCLLQVHFAARGIGARTAAVQAVASPGGSPSATLTGTGM
jgi:hypothetical protein